MWICLFTCAVYRAVRIEVVSSLSTDSFVQALRRFCSRQGRPRVMYSDNGSNFTGFDNVCEKLDWDAIAQYSAAKRITWHFNPPSAPWWGGFWERLIGVMKTLLRRVLGRSCVNYEELQTLLCDVESVINSRPLTYLSSDPQDLVALTPNMFLHDLKETDVPEYKLAQTVDLRKRLQYRQQLRDHLHKRFRSEYLGQLQLFANKKKPHELKINDLVFVGDDNTKRIDWPLGRIVRLIHGADGFVRVVNVRVSSGILTRPVQRVYPLELDCSLDEMTPVLDQTMGEVPIPSQVDAEISHSFDQQPIVSNDVVPYVRPCITKVKPTETENLIPKITRHGRAVKKPSKLNL